MSMPPVIDDGVPDLATCLPWDLDYTGCCSEFSEHDAQLQERAEVLAWRTLHTLTAGQVGNCPVIVRPCLTEEPCGSCFGGSWLNPTVDRDGNWINYAPRRNGECSCCNLCEVILPGPVAELQAVVVDGYTMDTQTFRIDDGDTTRP